MGIFDACSRESHTSGYYDFSPLLRKNLDLKFSFFLFFITHLFIISTPLMGGSLLWKFHFTRHVDRREFDELCGLPQLLDSFLLTIKLDKQVWGIENTGYSLQILFPKHDIQLPNFLIFSSLVRLEGQCSCCSSSFLNAF